MQLNRKYLFSVVLSLMFFQLQAQVQFAIKPGAKEIGRKDELQVDYEISGTDHVSNFEPPSFKDWRLLSGPVITSQNMSVNGVKTSLTKYTFYLIPKSTGKLTVPSTAVEAANKTLHCSEVVVNVKKQDHIEGASGQNSNGLFQGQDAIKGNDAEETTLKAGEDAVKKIKQNLFAKVVPNKKKVYVGEPVLVEYQLFTRVKSNSRIKPAEFAGCSVYEMTSAEPQPEQVIVNGKKFTKYIFRKVQLVPLQAGALIIPKVTLDNDVTFFSDDDYRKRFYDESSGTTQQYSFQTEPLSVEVVPLPKEASNYAVGNFSITTNLKKDTSAANEANALIVTITGAGNFKSVSQPDVNWSSDIYHFDASETDDLDKFVYPLGGKRTYEIPFEVNKAGAISIPEVSFSYFDPQQGKVHTVKSDALRLTVTPAVKNNLQTSVSAVDSSSTNIQFLYYIIPAVFILGAVMIFRNSRKKPALATSVETIKQQTFPAKQVNTKERLDDLLLIQGDAEFYNKARDIAKEMIQASTGDRKLLLEVLQDCNTMLYTPMPTTSKKELLEKLQQAIS